MLSPFEYVRVGSVEEACVELAESHGNAVLLAGGTDLLVEIRNGVKCPDLLIDIKRIESLHVLETPGAGDVVIGSGTTLNAIVENALLRARFPGLTEAALSIATYQLRNRATVVGNLCNASPAADMAPILLALEAQLDVSGIAGVRNVPLGEFFVGVKRTVLGSDEMVTAVRIPASPDVRTASLKQQRIRGHDLAVVNVAGAYDPVRSILRVAVGSCAPTPIRLDPIDTSGVSTSALVQHVMARAEETTSPITDVRGSSEYRRAVLPVLLSRLVESVVRGKEER